MVDDTVSREPTAHVTSDVDVDQPNSGDVDAGPTAHVTAVVEFHGAGEP